MDIILSNLNQFNKFFPLEDSLANLHQTINPTTPCICCHTTLWQINVRKKAIKDKLQGSVATYLRCDKVVNNQIKKGSLLGLSVKTSLKSANNRQSYKQERGCLVHFLLLAVWWSGAQTAWENNLLACDFVKYSLTFNFFSLTDLAINLSLFGYQQPHHTWNMS